MVLSLVLLRQLTTLFIFMRIGMLLFKTGKITERGSKDIATVLI